MNAGETSRNTPDSGRTGRFTYARTLIATETDGLRPYLLLARDGWISVVRLGLVRITGEAHGQAGDAASELARGFYQCRLRVLPERLQQRFHEQVNETTDPHFLLDRMLDEAHLVRIVAVEWELGRRPGQVVRAWTDEGDAPDRIGQRVLLAIGGTRDAIGEVTEIGDDMVLCRILDDRSGSGPA